MPGYTPQTWADLDPTKVLSAARMGVIETALNEVKTRWVNVKDWGATGNGSTDDTTAIQACLTAATDGTVIFFPAGIYLCAVGGLTCSTSVTLQGVGPFYDGTKGSVLKTTATNATLFAMTGPAVNVYGMSFWHASTGTRSSGLIGLSCTNCNFNRIERNQFSGFSTGCKMDTGVYWTFNDNNVRDFVLVGLDARYTGSPDSGDVFITNNTFDRTNADASTGGKGIFCTTLGGLFVQHNKINGRSGANAFDDAVHFQAQDGLTDSAIMIQNNSLESARTGILIDKLGTTGSISNSLVITGNEINGLNNAGSTGISISAGGAPDVRGVVIGDNNIVLANIGIDVGNILHTTVSGNSLYSITTTGMRFRTLVRDLNIGGNVIDMISGGKAIIYDDPPTTSDNSYSTSMNVGATVGITDASSHDVFEIGVSAFAPILVDIDFQGVNQGSGAFARRITRQYAGNTGGTNPTVTTVGTDYTTLGSVTMTFTPAADKVTFSVTKSVGTSLGGILKVTARGMGLTYFKPLMRDN